MTTHLTAYLLESKADWPDPATEPDPTDAVNAGDEEGLEWAGDLYEEGDESDPTEAFATFGGEGLEAWLDRADDGTLTGWVRDTDGSVYRYSDVDAWAIDVRDAGMPRTDPSEAGDPDADGDVEGGDDPDAAQDGTDPDADGDTEGGPDDTDAATDELAPGEAEVEGEIPAKVDPSDEAADPNNLQDPTDPDALGAADSFPEGATKDDPEAETFFGKVKRRGEGKSFVLTYTPWEGE